MTDAQSEKEFRERFSERYRRILSPVLLDIEEEALGTRVGASSWSTPEQVEVMAEASGLGAGDQLLDIGSGAGWPGLRIGELTGATVTLSDITEEGLGVARHINSGTRAVVADGSKLPFGDASFEAVTHSDVLCCLSRKEQTLRECRRVLVDRGVMVFAVIATGPHLDEKGLEVLAQPGNEFLFSERSYPNLLEDAGFEFEIEDVTPEFGRLADRLHTARSARLEQLVEVLGEDDAEAAVQRAAFNCAAADARSMIRHYVVARPSP